MKLVDAAKREGLVVVNTQLGTSYRKHIDSFERAFPGITVEHTTYSSGSIFAPKVLQERAAGIYTYDVTHGPPNTAISTLLPNNVWDPIRPVIMQRSDMTNDSLWTSGFEAGFAHRDRQWTYVHAWRKRLSFWVNTDHVKDGEVKTARDLLDPKWKGRMLLADVRVGCTFIPATALRMKMDDDYVKQWLVDQQPAFSRDDRQIADNMIRGNYAITNRLQLALFSDYLAQGLGKT